MIVDSHAHYDDSAFADDRHQLLPALHRDGVAAIVSAASSIPSAKANLELAERYPFVFATAGVHPSDVGEMTQEDLEQIRQLYQHPKVIAIGEIGLDYHYALAEDAPADQEPADKQTFPFDYPSRALQRQWFEQQLALAKELDAPVVVHNREAHGDVLQLLRRYRPKGVVHCFSGSVETMQEVLKLGLYIGLGGAVTFKNAVKPVEVAKAVPLDRLLLETDAPYMAPVPYRGKRCDSRMIRETAAKIAAVRGEAVDTILQAAAQNTVRLFPKMGGQAP